MGRVGCLKVSGEGRGVGRVVCVRVSGEDRGG